MQVTIRYYGQLKETVGVGEQKVECNSSLCDLLAQQANLFGDKFRQIVFDDTAKIRPSVIVTVNNNSIDKTQPPQLKDGDEIVVLSAIAGG